MLIVRKHLLRTIGAGLIALSIVSCRNSSKRVLLPRFEEEQIDSLLLEGTDVESLPVVPDEALSDERKIMELRGIALGEKDRRAFVMNSDIGLYLKSTKYDKYDFETRFLPKQKIYLAGKIIVSENYDVYVVIWGDSDKTVYFVTAKDRRIIGVVDVAEAYDDYIAMCGDDDGWEPVLCERISENTFVVHWSNSASRRIVFREDGTISKQN